MQATQLSLWETPQPTPAPSRPALPPGGYYPDEIMITCERWSDGDTRDLERLALLRLGDTHFVKFTWACIHGKYAVFRAISTSVIEDCVQIAWEYECTDVEFFCHLPHTPVEEIIEEWLAVRGDPECAAVDEEEEDVA